MFIDSGKCIREDNQSTDVKRVGNKTSKMTRVHMKNVQCLY